MASGEKRRIKTREAGGKTPTHEDATLEQKAPRDSLAISNKFASLDGEDDSDMTVDERTILVRNKTVEENTIKETVTVLTSTKIVHSTSNHTESVPKKRKIDEANGNESIRELSKLERKQLKKKNKTIAKKSEGNGSRPCFMLSRDYDKLSIKDIRDLVIYLLTETKTLPWIMVKNKFRIDKVLLLYVPGLDPNFFNIDLQDPEARKPIPWAQRAMSGPATEFQHLKTFFDVMNVMKAGGDKQRIHHPVDTLLNVPLSNAEQRRRDQEMKSKRLAAKNFGQEHYMLRIEDLRESNFPLPTYLDSDAKLAEEWFETKQKTSRPSVPKKMVAMDCEMVRTTAGSEVTRVSVVDDEGVVIYDELVMPDNPIVDYLTQYSGMTAERLNGVTTKLADVQKKLQELVTYDTILVGHSLENDMKVLKFAHPFIIDTTVAFHHTRGPPFRPSLKWLALKWLQRRIQAGGDKGHDSVEDARACMDLAKLKIREGPGFGEYNQDQESIFSRISRHTTPRSSAVIDRETFIGQSAASTVIKAANDTEVVEAVAGAIQEHNLVWARLRGMEINYGRGRPSPAEVDPEASAGTKASAPSTPHAPSADRDETEATMEELLEAVKSIDKSIAKIIESLPENTAVIVTSGQGDLREVRRMQARQKNFQRLYNTLNLSAIPKEDQFLDEDQKALEEAVNRAKHGVCFFMVR
ncbi:hypothetical protein BC939DRAFT_418742 [Gamsiella multidivaricata]|uniref:uncharacterized protein n=1 Tax=Gamsiella multidivaricata TaxID=101098 RepID=UPI00221F4D4D|nr:uncharacterized protein BC939DRAFT_418742 [Gamsiella multidivaricata]KAG0364437.1 hypothetical protein BGZ54_007528 [Gamsiella multidivaricata]KAI7831636.1 hypothetical protein BC939DRAFT_418742 [Gamsiella multidivaricata]